MHMKKKERINKTIQNKTKFFLKSKHSEITNVNRMQFTKLATLGLVLLSIFISDPDYGTETTSIKLTTNQLDGTANYISGQKGELDKWSEKKDDMQNTACRQKSIAKILSGQGRIP